jgi:hypothetical protein
VDPREVRPLSAYLADVDTRRGRERLAAYLATQPFPRFEAADERGLLVKVDADGTRTRGRFVNRQFLPT